MIYFRAGLGGMFVDRSPLLDHQSNFGVSIWIKEKVL